MMEALREKAALEKRERKEQSNVRESRTTEQ
jgi:hypothetical protein